jgi:Xaa-Pro aminopeptidase
MDAPEEFRGIGVRIEDDVVVTATGCENMTAEAPKEVSELEAIIGRLV